MVPIASRGRWGVGLGLVTLVPGFGLTGQVAGRAVVPPVLAVVPDLRIAPQDAGVQRNGFMAIAPAGRMIVASQFGDARDFHSTGRRLWWKIPRARRHTEFWRVPRLGWRRPM